MQVSLYAWGDNFYSNIFMTLKSIFILFLFLLLGVLTTSCGGCGDDFNPVDMQSDTRFSDASMADMSVDSVADIELPKDTMHQSDITAKKDAEFPDFSFDFNTPDMEPEIFHVDSILPPSGPVEGGTSVVVVGSGFTRDTLVFFGSRQANLELVDGNLVGLSPLSLSAGPVNLKVLHPSDGTQVLSDGFTYTDAIGILSIVPASVPIQGGVEVTIHGKGFSADTRFSFGGKTGLRHTAVSKQKMRVIVPPNSIGAKNVRLSSPTGSAIAYNAIQYFAPLELHRIRPAAGNISGGETVTLLGNFQQNMQVEFEGRAASTIIVALNGKSAQVVTPIGNIGLADVQLRSTTDAFLKKDAFYYYQNRALKLVSVEPNIGSTLGNSVVQILGLGLDDPTLEIRFGGQLAQITEQGIGHVLVKLPAHATGVVNIHADTQTDSAILVNAFTYVDGFEIDSISPTQGPTTGGTSVLIKGIGFTNIQDVKFGSFSASFIVNSDTEIVATTPRQSMGEVDVSITRDGLDARLKNAFSYREDLNIYAFTPIKGSVAGNTYVELQGRGFFTGIEVTVDGLLATDIRVIDTQTIAFRTPAHAVGAARIKLISPDQQMEAPFDYTYFNPGARFGGAWGDPIAGAVNITVFSTEGSPIENAFVMLSTNAQTPYQGKTNAEGLVTLSGPDVIGEQTVSAVAAGYSSVSVQRVNAENITLFLAPPPSQGPQPPGTAPAVFTGNISGLDKMAEPGPKEFQMAIVQTTKVNPYRRNPPTGDANVVIADGEYTLNSRLGDVAVIAVGGLYNNDTQKFTPLRMGIKRFLFATSGQTQRVDIDLNIPLTTTLTVKMSHVPNYVGGPVKNRVTPFLDLGFEGVFEIAKVEGSQSILMAHHQAALTGDLANASYFITGGAFGAGNLPQTNSILRNVTQISQVINLPGFVGIADLTSPAESEFPVDRLFQFKLEQNQSPSFFYVIIQDTMQKPVWNVFLPGNERSFRLPDFPDFSHLPETQRPVPYPGGLFIVDIIGFKKPAGFNYNNVSYNDLGIADVDSYSYSRRFVQF